MKMILWITIILLLTLILWAIDKPRQDAINKYQCAVWGYAADCKTPLAPEDRLK